MPHFRSPQFWSYEGRAGRAEYWKTFIAIYGVWILIVAAWIALSIARSGGSSYDEDTMGTAGMVAIGISAFAWMMSAVSVRRLHDIGRDGRFIIWNRRKLVPIGVLLTGAALPFMAIGISSVAIVLLIAAFACLFPIHMALTLTIFAALLPSQPGPNQYGPNPLEVTQ